MGSFPIYFEKISFYTELLTGKVEVVYKYNTDL